MIPRHDRQILLNYKKEAMSKDSDKKNKPDSHKPKLIVFDLDYTLWPFWVDTHINPPVSLKGGKLYDRSKREVKPYSEVPKVLKHLKDEGHTLAVASRTGAIQLANQLLDHFEWNEYFDYKEIYPGAKTTHFQRLKRQSNYEFEEMIFLDDEHRNIRDVSSIGVHSVLVEDGVSMKVIHAALQSFKESKKAAQEKNDRK